MGCDIHFYVEKREGGRWVSADEWTPSKHKDEPGLYVRACYYHERNYDLFAILADVRNGHGFRPIAPPRGLPDDVTENVRAASDRYGDDGHSHSWLTLAELLAYDWTQVATLRGAVNGPEYLEWMRWRADNEGPKSYCGMVNGSGVQFVTEAGMRALVGAIAKRTAGPGAWQAGTEAVKQELGLTYCEVQWTEPYYRRAERFWSRVIPRLLRLGHPDDVRVVFWFDN